MDSMAEKNNPMKNKVAVEFFVIRSEGFIDNDF